LPASHHLPGTPIVASRTLAYRPNRPRGHTRTTCRGRTRGMPRAEDSQR
jgi:hypothetical protein